MQTAVRVDQPDGVLVDARAGRRARGRGSTPYAVTPATTRTAAATSTQRRAAARAAAAAACAGSASAAAGTSSAGSWARIASCSSRSSAPGLDADLLDERRARVAVGLERLGLPAGSVQREHALRVQALAQRLRRRPAAPARRSPRRAGPPRGRASIALSAARSRSSSRRRISAAANGSPATSASASPRHRASASRARDSLEQALEAHDVDLVAGELQLVAAVAGDDPRAARRRAAGAGARRRAAPSSARSPAAPRPTGPRRGGRR